MSLWPTFQHRLWDRVVFMGVLKSLRCTEPYESWWYYTSNELIPLEAYREMVLINILDVWGDGGVVWWGVREWYVI